MFFYHFFNDCFENVDEIIKIQLMIPPQMDKKSKKSEILGSLKNKDSTFRTIVNSKTSKICLGSL